MYCDPPNVKFPGAKKPRETGAKDSHILELGQLMDQSGKDPLGHPPDNGILELIGLDLAALARDLKVNRVVRARLHQIAEGDPAGRRHLGIQQQLGAGRRKKDERTNGNGGQYRSAGNHVFQQSGEVRGGEIDPHLLDDLADGRGNQVPVGRVPATAGQGHVAGPGVTRALSAPNQEDGIRVRHDDDRHRGPDQGGIVSVAGLALGQPFLEPGEPAAQCE